MTAGRTDTSSRSLLVRHLRRFDQILASVAFYPLVFAAYAVLQTYVNNLAGVPARDVLITMFVVLAMAAVGYALVTILYRDTRRAALPATITIVLILGYGYLREALAPYWSGGPALFLLCGAVAIAVVAIAARRATQLAPITQAMNVASLLLLTVAVIPIATFASQVMQAPATLAGDALPPSAIDAGAVARSDSAPRDIYYIVLDRYGSEQALVTGRGIDNAEFIDWLREQGFQVLDEARANYVRSSLSLGSTLSMSLLDDIAARLGPASGNYAPVVDLVRRSPAAAVLQTLGYEYIHIGSWYSDTRHSLIADQGFASPGHSSFPSAFLRYTAAGLVADALGISETGEKVHADAAEYQFGILRSMFDEPGPKLVFAHVLLPHSPYVFTEEGAFDPEMATFASQLSHTNREVRSVVEPLLDLPEPERPIIILQADEGPYPDRYAAAPDAFDWAAATEDELVTKFGILNAMYLPGPEGEAPLPSSLSSVNTFREILTRYFDADLPNLPDRNYGSTESRPYDLTDITDHLPSPD